MKLSNEETIQQVDGQAAEWLLEINRLSITYPELRPFFYENVPVPPKHPARYRIEAIAESMLDLMDFSYTSMLVHPRYKENDEKAWRAWIVDSFRNSAPKRDFYDRHRTWYSDELIPLREMAK